MIKYLGSKRRLVPALGELFAASGAHTALDLFTGTTRVAQEFQRRGGETTAVDVATYSEILAKTYVELDMNHVDPIEVQDALDRLMSLPPVRGYITETFCERARYFHPKNGVRIDAIRQGVDDLYGDSWLRPLLLTSLMEAADAVDSTVGLQMAFLKQWAARAHNDLRLRQPILTPGGGQALRGDATELVNSLPRVDLAYLDPPYNQHRYFTNYHIWETLIRWDAPEAYGIAAKRLDSRDDSTKSVFNKTREMPPALADVVKKVDADTLILSFSDEGFVRLPSLIEMCESRGQDVRLLQFDSKRYVGSQIGIYNPSGQKVGQVGHARNLEYVLICGEARTLDHMADAVSHLEKRDPVVEQMKLFA